MNVSFFERNLYMTGKVLETNLNSATIINCCDKTKDFS